MNGNDYNPFSVVTAETHALVNDLSLEDVSAVVTEHPHILNHQPPEDCIPSKKSSGLEVVKACVQIEVEVAIDMPPFSEALRTWRSQAYKVPSHLAASVNKAMTDLSITSY